MSNSNITMNNNKVRFDGLDVTAMVGCLLSSSYIGRRVVNIYDDFSSSSSGSSGDTGSGNNDCYIFKFEKNGNDNTANSNKDFIIIMESGIRFHSMASYQAPSASTIMPTPFCSKLRKHLRGLRLENIRQLGNFDRIVMFQFGVGSGGGAAAARQYYIILELYSRGNLILTDSDFVVLALLRSHMYYSSSSNHHNNGEGQEASSKGGGGGETKASSGANSAGAVAVQVGQVYPVSYATTSSLLQPDGEKKKRKKDIEGGGAVAVAADNSAKEDAEEEEKGESAEDDGDTTNATTNTTTTTALLNCTTAYEFYHNWALPKIIQRQRQQQQQAENNNNNASSSSKKGKKGKKKKKKHSVMTLKTLLLQNFDSGVSHFGPALLEHCILSAGLQPHAPLLQLVQQDGDGSEEPPPKMIMTDDEWNNLKMTLQTEGPRILQSLSKESSGDGGAGCCGYILYRPATKSNTTKTDEEEDHDDENDDHDNDDNDKLYEEFLPVLLKQHEHRLYIKYDNFATAVSAYYDRIQIQKFLQRAATAEKNARQKLDKIRHDQHDRLQGLIRQQHVLLKEAQTVQSNADHVDQALTVINSALDSGMDWEQLEHVINVEQKQNANPIALLIQQLDLQHDAMILRLPTSTSDTSGVAADTADVATTTTTTRNEDNADDDDNDATTATIDVRILLKESAYANANRLFEKYRQSKDKSQKTIEASSKALQAAEENAQKQLAEAQKRRRQGTANLSSISQQQYRSNKPAWFEKFHWFITSDNYLVLGGKDAHQNELLVKRYLRPGDAYLHADVHGAASCVLRAKRRRRRQRPRRHKQQQQQSSGSNNTEVLPLSEQALREAGNFTICRSSAWSTRMVTSAWWVESHQVTKTAPSGEYLTVGSFMIRGKKNFLPPSTLEMGLAVLFRLADEESILRHKNERRDFALLEYEEADDDDEEEVVVDDSANDGAVADVTTSENTLDGDQEEVEESTSNPAVLDTCKDEQRRNESPSNRIDAVDQSAEDLKLETGNDIMTADAVTDDVVSNNEESAEEGPIPNENSEDSDNGNGEGTDNGSKPQKRGLSARDRRLIKKYGSLEAAEEAARQRDQQEEKTDGGKSKKTVDRKAADSQASHKRGKKGKQKRASRKYADQDEEDRELAMLALQGGEKSKKKKRAGKRGKANTNISEKQEQVAAETKALLAKDAAAVAEKLPDKAREILAECVTVQNPNDNDATTIRWDKFDATALEQLLAVEPMEAQTAVAERLLALKQRTRIDNFSASLGGIIRTVRKHGHENLNKDSEEAVTTAPKRKTKSERNEETQKWKSTLEEEGVVDNDLDDDAVDDTAELGKLTGKPHPDDLLLAAVPVCAPYQTLSQYAYRVKLTPGNMKRGKASKQCIDLFLKGGPGKKNASIDRQLDLIKRVSDNDWVQVICADVKIAAAGASKAAKKQKANTKKKAKK